MEKYNPDNIFKNRNNSIQDNQSVHKEMSLVDYKISWYKKILNKIRKMFSK